MSNISIYHFHQNFYTHSFFQTVCHNFVTIPQVDEVSNLNYGYFFIPILLVHFAKIFIFTKFVCQIFPQFN